MFINNIIILLNFCLLHNEVFHIRFTAILYNWMGLCYLKKVRYDQLHPF